MKIGGKSLRTRLLTLLLGGYVGFSVLILVMLYKHAHFEIDELFDEQLRQIAVSLLITAENQSPGSVLPAMPLRQDGEKRFRFQVVDSEGNLRINSPDVPYRLNMGPDGYTLHNDSEGHWREVVLSSDDGKLKAWVAENHGYRDRLIKETVIHVLFPLLFGLPILGIWVWIATGKGLAPLARLTRQLECRGADQLARLPDDLVLQEVAPLVSEINRLLAEVEHALQSERRFTGEAAHELRTPVAALQAQAQVALRARNGEERDHALDKLGQGLGRVARLLDQMLVLARLDPERGLPDPTLLKHVNLGALAQEVCASLGGMALGKQLEFELLDGGEVVLWGQEDWLRILLRNLVDNSIRYTPSGGRVWVRLAREATGSILVHVEDSGPGIPPESRQQVLGRFCRLDQSGQTGSGLGLSIALRIVELHGAEMVLDQSDAGGLQVMIRFPAATVSSLRD